MNKRIKVLAWLLVCFFSSLFFRTEYIFYHEAVHQQLFRTMNVESEITLERFKIFGIETPFAESGYTTSEKHNYTETEAMMVASFIVMNDMVGYHFIAFISLIAVLVFCLGTMIIIYEENKNG